MHPIRFPALAFLFLTLLPGTSFAQADPDGMAERLQPCTVCHGKEGRATPDGFYPRIAGKPAGYLYRQLANFRDGRRHNATMTWMVSRMSDDYLREIAGYFAASDLPYPPPQARQASAAVLARGRRLVVEGDPARHVPACARCHGGQATGIAFGVSPAPATGAAPGFPSRQVPGIVPGIAPWIPGLLGLPHGYIAGELGAWRSGSRHADAPDCMATIAARLDLGDVDAVASWLAAQAPPPDYRPLVQPSFDLPLACGSVPR